MSEKLAAFITLYTEKAQLDVDRAKTGLTKAKDRLTRAIELWNTIRSEAENLGILDKFIDAFPEPGGSVIATIGTSVNPNYTVMLEYGDQLKGLVRELTKLKDASRKVGNAENSLKFAESVLSRPPEDHVNALGFEIVKIASQASSTGAKSTDSVLKSFFNDYEGFKSIMQTGLDDENVYGPSGVNTSQPAFDLLKERFESGELVKKQEETTASAEGFEAESEKSAIEDVQSSPINEREEDKIQVETGEGPASPINVTESPIAEEATDPEVAGTPPALSQPKEPEQASLVANINIEQTEAPGPAEAPPPSPVSPESSPSTPVGESKAGAEPEAEVASSSTFMNMDFSKMSAEEIANSFLTGDVFGETKNEFSNVFGGKTVFESPINQPTEESTPETAVASASTFMNMDFSKMSAEEIANSFLTGDVFGETKNEFSNVFGGEGIFKPKEEGSSSESVENKKTSSGNIFSRGRESGSGETVERGSAKMSAPAAPPPPPPSMSTSLETSTSNVTNQSIENQNSGPVTNQTSTASNVTNDNSDQSTSESMSSNRSSMMQSAGSDNSDIVARLKRLERLLSGPLEVKIVES